MRRRKLSPLLTIAGHQPQNYRIKPTPQGFALWRFKDWSRTKRGWSVLARYPTREAAEQDLLERLDLEPEKPKPKQIMATISYVDTFDYYGGWG